MEKKSERLEVRLGHQEKEAFTDACEMQGDTPSGAIRRFIGGYVKRSDSDVLSGAVRKAAKRRLPKLVFITGVVCLSLAGIWGAYQHLNQMSDDEIFSARDRNGDGVLTAKELPPVFDDLRRVMDLDVSGDISQGEFLSKGERVFVLSGPKGDPLTKFKARKDHRVTLVKFHISPVRIKSGTYEISDTYLKNVDRVVFWHDGGGITVMNGPVRIDDSAQVEINAGK